MLSTGEAAEWKLWFTLCTPKLTIATKGRPCRDSDRWNCSAECWALRIHSALGRVQVREKTLPSHENVAQEEDSMEAGTSTAQLTRTIRWLQLYAALMTVALVALFVRSGTVTDGVIRTRGLIIEDEAGRERILIGAPIPEAANRVRTDEARVREVWAPAYPDPDAYMGYYQDYNHNTNGILILSEDGFDRLAVGDPTPDPNIGRRIAPSTGMVINDDQGFERMGYGVKPMDGRYRVSMGLDTDRIEEGLVLILDDDGPRGILVGTLADGIFLGSAPAGHAWSGLAEAFQGLRVRRAGETVYEMNLAEGN